MTKWKHTGTALGAACIATLLTLGVWATLIPAAITEYARKKEEITHETYHRIGWLVLGTWLTLITLAAATTLAVATMLAI
ncbi:MAG: hypothetical protein FJY76_01835 [Candidatus Aenigmarchaeota archaeon]|nr:hypothetical protein [Candidatus Aenigmarchaeota archaeon]